MEIGKRLLILGCSACAGLALVFIAVTPTALSNLVISEKPLCIPGVSLRCHKLDCGDYFQRCGSNALHEVPSGKVCYQGALLPASRTDLHPCLPTVDTPLNSSKVKLRGVSHPRSAVGGCISCSSQCPGFPNVCNCMCSTQGQGTVICGGRVYHNLAVAKCCLGSHATCRNSVSSLRERVGKVFKSMLGQVRELKFVAQRLLQNVAASFIFPAPASASINACTCSIGTCSNACG